MSTDGAFPDFLAEGTSTLVGRLRRWSDDPASEPSVNAWYDEFYRDSDYGDLLMARRSGRLLPMMQWEIEHSLYSAICEVARNLERQARPKEALNIYRAILLAFVPRGTLYYERPAILLEHMGRYDEAIVICDRAIKVIEARLFHADAEPFKNRKARLLAKKERRES